MSTFLRTPGSKFNGTFLFLIQMLTFDSYIELHKKLLTLIATTLSCATYFPSFTIPLAPYPRMFSSKISNCSSVNESSTCGDFAASLMDKPFWFI